MEASLLRFLASRATSHMCHPMELYVELGKVALYNIEKKNSRNVEGKGKGNVNV